MICASSSAVSSCVDSIDCAFVPAALIVVVMKEIMLLVSSKRRGAPPLRLSRNGPLSKAPFGGHITRRGAIRLLLGTSAYQIEFVVVKLTVFGGRFGIVHGRHLLQRMIDIAPLYLKRIQSRCDGGHRFAVFGERRPVSISHLRKAGSVRMRAITSCTPPADDGTIKWNAWLGG